MQSKILKKNLFLSAPICHVSKHWKKSPAVSIRTVHRFRPLLPTVLDSHSLTTPTRQRPAGNNCIWNEVISTLCLKMPPQKENKKSTSSQAGWRWIQAKKMEPAVGLEPTTCWLQVNCSTNWAKLASFDMIHFSNITRLIQLCKGKIEKFW